MNLAEETMECMVDYWLSRSDEVCRQIAEIGGWVKYTYKFMPSHIFCLPEVRYKKTDLSDQERLLLKLYLLFLKASKFFDQKFPNLESNTLENRQKSLMFKQYSTLVLTLLETVIRERINHWEDEMAITNDYQAIFGKNFDDLRR